jgi:WD40 repeat protein
MLLTGLKGHKSQISQIIFSQDNKYLISASWDCTVRVWSLENLDKD